MNKPLGFVVTLLLIAAVLLVFYPVASFEFIHLDDDMFLVDNPWVTQGLTAENWRWAWTSTTLGGIWHPLVWLSHMLDVELFGMDAGAHHRTNLVLHLATALLLFALYRRWTAHTIAAGFVAALFALHPLRVESVAWVTERKDVLSGLFFMLTLLAYTRYVARPSFARYALVLGAFACGLSSKAMLVTLPLALLLLDRWPLAREEPLRKRVIEKIPLFALSFAATVVFITSQHRPLIEASEGLASRFLRVGEALAHYLRTTLWPTDLAVYYPAPETPSFGIGILGLLLGVLVTGAVFSLRRRAPWAFSGWGWFAIMILPVSGLFEVGRAELAADRYTYLPSIGLVILVVEGARRLRAQRIAFGLGIVALVLLGFVAHRQTALWKDSETLFSHTLAVTERNDLIHFNYAAVLFEQGRLAEAASQYRELLEIRPGYPRANQNRGIIALERGDLETARERFQAEVRHYPNYAPAHTNLGVTWMQLGRSREALDTLETAIRIDPELADAQFNLGLARLSLGRPDLAREALTKALLLEPDCADCALRLAESLELTGHRALAIAVLEELLRRRPGYPAAVNQLRGLRRRPRPN